MKKKLFTIILACTVELQIPWGAEAQGTFYFSNLGQASGGTAAVGSDRWIAQGFHTGTNLSVVYDLNAIQLQVNDIFGSPSGFDVSLYASSLFLPGTKLGSLSGTSSASGGTFTYSTTGITLLPRTTYFIVLTSATPLAIGDYILGCRDKLLHLQFDQWLVSDLYRHVR